MDINKQLNDIIFKYNLDDVYPQYKRMLKAEEYLQSWMTDLKRNDKKLLCIANYSCDIEYFSFLNDKIGCNMKCVLFHNKLFEEISLDGYDMMYSISMDHRNIDSYCERYDGCCKSIYEDLKKNGLVFDLECYRLVKNEEGLKYLGKDDINNAYSVQFEYYVQRQRAENCTDLRAKALCLRKCYFLLLFMKDFLNAGILVEEIVEESENDFFENCFNSWNEIQTLLLDIKSKLNGRRHKDIIMVWMDNIGYNECDNMPFLKNVRKSSIDFKNAFTVMPWTHETLKSLFCGTKVLDDQSWKINNIDERNSEAVRCLTKHNYGIKVTSGYRNFFNNYKADPFFGRLAGFPEISWGMMWEMLQNDKPLFLLGHALAESHMPHVFTNMTKRDISSIYDRVRNARTELDRQMEYAAKYYGDESIRIYMSDHGSMGGVCSRVHVNFMIQGKGIKPGKVEGMFSYVNFYRVISQLLESGDISEEALTDDFVRIEGVDFYNGRMIANNVIKNRCIDFNTHFGFQGVVDREIMYVKYNTGKELLIKRQNPYLNMCSDIQFLDSEIDDEGRAAYYRKLNRDYSYLQEDEKFKYSKYLYKILEKSRPYLEERKRYVEEFFEQFEDNSIAIKWGGDHTLGLYKILSVESRKKIKCIIDRNPGCKASTLGLPVYSPEGMDYSSVKYILPSSTSHENVKEMVQTMKEQDLGVEVIDIYEYMEEKGIRLIGGIYQEAVLPAECFDVGFPMEDFEQ